MANTFTHSELKEWLSENHVITTEKVDGEEKEVKLSKKQADELLKAIFTKIADEVAAGNDVKILGLGTAKRIKREQRTVRNPQNREETIVVPAHFALKVEAEKSLKERLKEIVVTEEVSDATEE